MTGEELEELVDRLLEAGIPPTAIAHALEMDPIPVRERLSQLRVREYGTAELSEAIANLEWSALERAKRMLSEGNYNVQARFVMGVLSKAMSLTARQAPDTMAALRNEVLDLYQKMGDGSDGDDILADVDTAPFVAVAPPDDGEDEEPGPGAS